MGSTTVICSGKWYMYIKFCNRKYFSKMIVLHFGLFLEKIWEKFRDVWPDWPL